MERNEAIRRLRLLADVAETLPEDASILGVFADCHVDFGKPGLMLSEMPSDQCIASWNVNDRQRIDNTFVQCTQDRNGVVIYWLEIEPLPENA